MTKQSMSNAALCNNSALRKATRRVSQLYDAVLAPSGLRSTQMAILTHIDRAGTPAMGELAAALVLDRSALGHNLKPLERDGLVELVANVDQLLHGGDVHIVNGAEIKDNCFQRRPTGKVVRLFAALGSWVIPGAVTRSGIVVEVGSARCGEDDVGKVVEVVVCIGIVEAFGEAVDEDSRIWRRYFDLRIRAISMVNG